MAKVKVLIAVSIDAEGNWNAAGWGNIEDDNKVKVDKQRLALDLAKEPMETNPWCYWVQAEIEKPIVQKIKGDVKDG